MNPVFEVYADGEENRPRTRQQGKKSQPANKRQALGVLSNKQRVQPARAAKVSLQENVPAKGGFACYQDGGQDKKFREKKQAKAPQQEIRPLVELTRQLVAKKQVLLRYVVAGALSPETVDEMHRKFDKVTGVVVREAHFKSYIFNFDIYHYHRELEVRFRPKPSYLSRQPDINKDMRSILVDWLVEVTVEYKLHAQTLHLAVNYIDRFLSYMSVTRDKLQLVGTTAMFIASKFEEIYPPDISEFVYVTDNSYTVNRVIKMEQIILKTLTFDMGAPTSIALAERLLTFTSPDDDLTAYLTYYLLELALVDGTLPVSAPNPYCRTPPTLHGGGPQFLQYTPSVLAAAAVFLARHNLGKEPWTKELRMQSLYGFDDIRDCVHSLRFLHLSAQHLSQQSVQTKYRSSMCLRVALLEPNIFDVE